MAPFSSSLVFLSTLFSALSLTAQSQASHMVILQKTTDEDGYSEQREIFLSGADAAAFQWRDHIVPAGADLLAIRYSGPDPVSVFPKIEGIRMIDEKGRKVEYTRPEGLSSAGYLPGSLSFRQTDQSAGHFLPCIHLEKIESDLSLLWLGTGECPDEMTEDRLPNGVILVQLLDENQGILQLRTIASAPLLQTDGTERRRVFVEVQTYEQSLSSTGFRWRKAVKKIQKAFLK